MSLVFRIVLRTTTLFVLSVFLWDLRLNTCIVALMVIVVNNNVLEPRLRLELRTPSLPWRCSTTELSRQYGAGWRIRTSELVRGQIYSLQCLTASLTPHGLLMSGATCRIRTDDPQFTKLML